MNIVKNLIADFKALANSPMIVLPRMFYSQENKVEVDNDLIFKFTKAPKDIAMIIVVTLKNKEYQIICNEGFLKLPKWVQAAFIAHEEGHIKFGIKSEYSRSSAFYYEEELKADLYSMDQGHNMWNALTYYFNKHPTFCDVTRLENINKANGTNWYIPKRFKVISFFGK